MEASLDANVNCLRSNHVRRYQQAFKNSVRILPEQIAVLERPRLSLGSVAYDVTLRARMVEYRFPFDARRKTRAAPTSQTGSRNLVNNFGRAKRSGDKRSEEHTSEL